MIRRAIISGVSGLALALCASVTANAAVISATVNAPLAQAPIVVSFNGVAEFAFTAATTGFGPGAAVTTIGTGQVTTAGGALTDFGPVGSIDQTGELYTFAGYSTPTVIPYSAADDFIGLSFTLNDGVHYGYAEVFGPSLASVAFESTPGASIAIGATGTGAGIRISTPEPGSVVLLLTGLAAISTRRKSRMA